MCYIWPSTKIICGWLQAHIPAFLTKKKKKEKKQGINSVLIWGDFTTCHIKTLTF